MVLFDINSIIVKNRILVANLALCNNNPAILCRNPQKTCLIISTYYCNLFLSLYVNF